MLQGPITQLKHMVTAERLPFTGAYIGSLVLTLYFALGVRPRFSFSFRSPANEVCSGDLIFPPSSAPSSNAQLWFPTLSPTFRASSSLLKSGNLTHSTWLQWRMANTVVWLEDGDARGGICEPFRCFEERRQLTLKAFSRSFYLFEYKDETCNTTNGRAAARRLADPAFATLEEALSSARTWSTRYSTSSTQQSALAKESS